jgi:hypothetical protein
VEPERDLDIIQKIIVIIVGLYRIVIDTPKVWETVCKGWNCFTKFLQALGGPAEVDTDGGLILSSQLSTSVILGGTATGSASCSATLS